LIRFRFSCINNDIKKGSLRLYNYDLNNPIQFITPLIDVEINTDVRYSNFNLFEKSNIKERISRGDNIFMAFTNGEPIAYLFATTKDIWVDEIKDWLIISPDEVYLYDALTFPEYRGKMIYPTLIQHVAEYYKELCFKNALIFTKSDNRSSIEGIENVNFKFYKDIKFFSIFGLKLWIYKNRRYCVQSRFKNEF